MHIQATTNTKNAHSSALSKLKYYKNHVDRYNLWQNGFPQAGRLILHKAIQEIA
jgi:hypothetical protein